MRWVVPVAAAALVGLASGTSPVMAGSEVIELKDGHQVVGEVVAEKANFLFVDLGFDIVKIPKDQVLRRKAGEEASKTPAGPSGPSLDADPTGFYKTADLKADPGQGPGPAVWRGGDLDRDSLGQGVGVHPQ